MSDKNSTSISNERLAKVFGNMLEVVSSYPALLEEGISNSVGSIDFFRCTPAPNESTGLGVGISRGRPYFRFHGGWFDHIRRKYGEPVTDPNIVVVELNSLCGYMYRDYSPNSAFLEEIVERFEKNLQEPLGRALVKQELGIIKQVAGKATSNLRAMLYKE